MDPNYITPNGVNVSITSHYVYLSYSVDSQYMIEIYFDSMEELLNELSISSLEAVSPELLCDYYFQGVTLLNTKKLPLFIS